MSYLTEQEEIRISQIMQAYGIDWNEAQRAFEAASEDYELAYQIEQDINDWYLG